MSLKLLADLCSKLQNASRLRMVQTSFVMTKQNLYSFLAMQRQGLVQRVTVAGALPPSDSIVDSDSVTQLADKLRQAPWDAYPDPQDLASDRIESQLPENPADRRIWIELKYYNGRPVINKASLISTPSRSITLSVQDLRRLLRGKSGKDGRRSDQVQPLVNPGDTLFLHTSEGLLEAREAIAKRLGGKALFRVN